MSRTIQSAHSVEQLTITGVFTIQGPQVVGGEGGIPEWVYDMFKDNPKILTVAINYEHNGVVYQQPFDLIEDMYQESVKFTMTNQFGCGPDNEDDVYTVEEFKTCVKCHDFVDDDGYGYPVKDSKADSTMPIYPSRVSEIPNDATHIVWYNR